MKCSLCEGRGVAEGTNARCAVCWGLRVMVPLTDAEIRKILDDAQTFKVNGHFRLAGDQHTAMYVEKEKLFRCHQQVSLLGKQMAHRFLSYGQSARVVVTPHGGSFVLAQSMACWLQDSRGPQIFCAYASEPAGDTLGTPRHLTFRPAFEEVVRDQRVFVFDDVWTRKEGGTTSKVINAVRRFDGDVVGAGCLVDRGGVTAEDLGLRHGELCIPLLSIAMDTFDPAVSCPMCDSGMPINKSLGHGA